jgi:Ca2+-transporting ATPase
MGHALGVRSERKLLLQIGLFSNMAAVIAIGLTIALQLVMIYTPFLNDLFNTTPLTAEQLLLAFAVGLVTLIYVEFDKMVFGRRAQSKANAAARADAAAA